MNHKLANSCALLKINFPLCERVNIDKAQWRKYTNTHKCIFALFLFINFLFWIPNLAGVQAPPAENQTCDQKIQKSKKSDKWSVMTGVAGISFVVGGFLITARAHMCDNSAYQYCKAAGRCVISNGIIKRCQIWRVSIWELHLLALIKALVWKKNVWQSLVNSLFCACQTKRIAAKIF